MKPSSNVCGTTTKVPRKTNGKKQINIPWNSRVFFQVGLIVSLLAMFFIMEIEVAMGNPTVVANKERIWEEPPFLDYVIEKKPVKTPIKKPTKPVKRVPVQAAKPITHSFTQIEDTATELEGKTISEGDPVTTPTVPSQPDGDATTETATILGVEFVPVFPGCEGAMGNNAKIDCMSSKIRSFIAKKFDAGKFDYFEPGSTQKIYTVFTIDVHGNVVDIGARATDKKLEAEAQRVIQKLPTMTPGRQGATAVNVSYSVPISFQVHN